MPVITVPCPCELNTRLDRQAEDAFGASWLGLRGHAKEDLLELLEARAGEARQRQDRRVLEERAHDRLAHVLGRQLDHRGVDRVDLRQRDQTALQSEQRHDRQVLARLRHDAVVGRDHQDDDVDARRAGDHVLDELLVPRHVDDADRASVRQLEARETDVDRHPPLLLLAQAVGVDSRQRLDERRLAVVDVAGRADDDGLDLHRGGAV